MGNVKKNLDSVSRRLTINIKEMQEKRNVTFLFRNDKVFKNACAYPPIRWFYGGWGVQTKADRVDKDINNLI